MTGSGARPLHLPGLWERPRHSPRRPDLRNRRRQGWWGSCLGSMHVGQGAQPELLDLAEGAACYGITEPHASRIKLSKRISHPTNVPFQGTLDSSRRMTQ